MSMELRNDLVIVLAVLALVLVGVAFVLSTKAKRHSNESRQPNDTPSPTKE